MSEQIDIDGVKFKIGYDSKAVADGLKGDEKKAEESGKKAGQSWGNAFGAVAGAIAGAKIVGFFKSAVNESAKLENALLKVSSTARAMGQSIQNATAAAESLASDGFMSVTQSAQALSNLMQTGLSLDQAKKFVTASKDITAFGNTIGDAAQATEDLTLGLLRGSALVIDNASPALKSLSREYEKVLQTQGKTAAATFAYNKILKESEKFAGDAARSMDTMTGAQKRFEAATGSASAEIGKSFQPALKGIYSTVSGLIESFTSWFAGLSQGSKSVLAIGAALAALVPVVASLGSAFALLSINPVVVGVVALIAAVTALSAVVANLNKTSKEIVENYKKEKKEVIDLGAKIQDLEAINKRTIKQELELINSKEALRKKAKELGLDYDTLAAKAKNYSDVVKAITEGARDKSASEIDAQRRQITSSIQANERQIQAAERAAGGSALSILQRGGRFISTPGAGTVDLRTALLDRDRLRAQLQTADLERASLFAVGEDKANAAASGGGGGKASPEFRFIKARDELKKLTKEYSDYLRLVGGANTARGQEATERFIIQKREIQNSLKQSIAEYIEDRYTAEKLAIDAQRDQQIANVRELVNTKAIGEKEAEERIQKIREANARKTAQIQAESFARTMQAAQASTQGFAQMLNARDVGSALSGQGSFLSGLSQFSPALKALGPVGQGIGAAGAIVSTLTSLFGKSDEERAREAEQQKRRDEEARAILELQANYQKNMLALQEAAAKLPFENLQREMRLADIQGQQRKLAGEDPAAVDASIRAQKLALSQGTLSSESGTISEGALFAGTGSSPEALISFVKDRAAQSLAVQQFMALLDQAATGGATSGFLSTILGQMSTYKGKIPDELFNAGISSLSGSISNLSAMEADYNMRLANWSRDPNKRNQDLLFGSTVNLANAQAGTASVIAANRSTAGNLSSEISRDTTVAENLLSVIEQSNTLQLEISANTKKTAENTAKALELRPDRERSFIDVGQGYIQSLGQRISGMSVARRLGEQNFQLPSGIGSASGVATAARTVQELTADLLSMNAQQNDTMIDILQDVRAGIIELVAVLDGNPNTVSGLSVSEFTRIQSEINRRRR